MINKNTNCTLIATGDLMFYGPMAEKIKRHNDFLWGFRHLDELKTGDILFGNFETPISIKQQNEPDAPDKYFSPSGMGSALKTFGYDVVNLANNHMYDFGEEGVDATIQELQKVELPFFGVGRNKHEASQPVSVLSRNGVKFGFLGYTTANNALDPKHNYVACFPDLERVSEDVQNLKKTVDVVVVSCHTGAQYNPYPAPEARQLAQIAMRAGASIYLGHHPHIPQGIEKIGEGLAVYSLGDFVAPVHTEETRKTYFVKINLESDRVVGYEIVPCYITDDCQTVPAVSPRKEEIRAYIEELSCCINDGRSDEMHFKVAKSRFFSQYVRSWIEELRFGGPKVIFRKIRNFRYYHLQLIGRTIFGKLVGMGRKGVRQ